MLKLLKFSNSSIKEIVEFYSNSIRFYFVSYGDIHSEFKVHQFEKLIAFNQEQETQSNKLSDPPIQVSDSPIQVSDSPIQVSDSPIQLLDQSSSSSSSSSSSTHPNYHINFIPRTRQVHQSWITTPFTTLYSFLYPLPTLFSISPDLVILNGPGTSVSLGISLLIITTIQSIFFQTPKKLKIVFVESFARIKNLSLSGKLLYHFVDEFIVLWPELVKKYPKATYLGKLF